MMPRSLAPALSLALTALSLACSPNKGTQVRASGNTFADSADQVFYDVAAPFENNGVKRGTLYADTMYVMNDQSRFDLLQGRVEFNTALGVPDGSMRADRGRYDRRLQTLEGWGNVVVKSTDGKSLKSPHVVYNQMHDRISSDTTYEFIGDNLVQTGKGFETNTALTRRSCKADCKTRASIAIPK